MIRHQQLKQRVPHALHAVVGGLHYHARFHRTNTRRRVHARAHVHHAYTANSHGLFVLLVAKSGNPNRVCARCVKNRGSDRDRASSAVDRESCEWPRPHASPGFAAAKLCTALPPARSPQGHTPAGHRRFKICASTSARKCFSTEAIGAGTTCPSPQIEVSRNAPESSSINATSAAEPFPSVQPVNISTNFCDPTRHGTHLPQDSLRKNCVEFNAISSMQRSSAHTTSAPEPSIEPASASDLKSSRTSAMDAGK